MTFRIMINFKDKEKVDKLIRISLNSEIVVNKVEDEYIISLSDDLNTNLYSFKEDEVEEFNQFSIERIN